MKALLRKNVCPMWSGGFYVVFSILGAVSLAFAADHTEAPGVMGAERSFLDITDVYAFKSPDDPSRLTVAMGIFSPVAAAQTPPLFAEDGKYVFYIDTNNDLVADSEIEVAFQSSSDGSQTYRVSGVPGAGEIAGTVSLGSDTLIAERDGARAFAGSRDDHFYFDFEAFRSFLQAPCVPAAGLRCPDTGTPDNFFSAFNAATIVIDFPSTNLPGIDSANSGNLNIWAKTFERIASSGN